MNSNINPNATPRSIRSLNRYLHEQGVQETLRRGKGYFYFDGGGSCCWYSASVNVFNLDAFTIAGWYEQWKRLKEENAEREESAKM